MMLIKITRESLKFIGSRSIQVNLVPRVLSYPPSVGRVGENSGNEVVFKKVL